MKRRIVVTLVFVLAIGLCAGLIWFNFFKERMIKDFFANMKPPAQAVSSAKVEAKTRSRHRRDRHCPGGKRRRTGL